MTPLSYRQRGAGRPRMVSAHSCVYILHKMWTKVKFFRHYTEKVQLFAKYGIPRAAGLAAWLNPFCVKIKTDDEYHCG